jgi:hypothetical protein
VDNKDECGSDCAIPTLLPLPVLPLFIISNDDVAGVDDVIDIPIGGTNDMALNGGAGASGVDGPSGARSVRFAIITSINQPIQFNIKQSSNQYTV